MTLQNNNNWATINTEPVLLDCYFIPNKNLTSASICLNCGKEKILHTIGEGLKATKTIIFTNQK